jgi:hypothetical protein
MSILNKYYWKAYNWTHAYDKAREGIKLADYVRTIQIRTIYRGSYSEGYARARSYDTMFVMNRAWAKSWGVSSEFYHAPVVF